MNRGDMRIPEHKLNEMRKTSNDLRTQKYTKDHIQGYSTQVVNGKNYLKGWPIKDDAKSDLIFWT